SVYSTVVKVVRELWSRFLPSSNLREKDWSKLSSPSPSAKSRFVAKLPEPQVDSVALEESSDEFVEEILADVDTGDDSDIDSQLDEESEIEIESGLAAIEPDFESEDQRLEPDLPEPDLPEQESEQDRFEETDEEDAGDVSDVELNAESSVSEAPLKCAETASNEAEYAEAEPSVTDVDKSEIAQPEDEVVEGEASALAEQNQLNIDSQSETVEPEIDETEISELIIAQQNDDSEVNLSVPAIHLPEIASDSSSDSSSDTPAIPPTEIVLSSEQPIAEFVSHKLINMEIKHIVEAALFASGSAMSVTRLYRVFDEEERPERSEIRAALTILQQDYADKAVQLVEVAGGFRFQVKADYASWVARLFEERPPKYSRALLETLSIIAYRQPVTRGDIESIRGVSVSTQMIQTLQEREWVKVVGHKEVPGKPALFATTSEFLDYFNLKSLTDLPPLSEFIIPDEIPEQLPESSTEDENDQPNQQTEENQANQA
ncbi:MAG: SMC-Scp complex subunit ScpB, partial [Methylococcales bacterium]